MKTADSKKPETADEKGAAAPTPAPAPAPTADWVKRMEAIATEAAREAVVSVAPVLPHLGDEVWAAFKEWVRDEIELALQGHSRPSRVQMNP